LENQLFMITIVVPDYQEAIDYYVNILGFLLLENKVMSTTKNWVVVSPGINSSCKILLAKAADQRQIEAIGNQTGGRVGFFMHTSNLNQYYTRLKDHQVKIIREPSDESFGTVFVFQDKYGNLWDLIQPK
jgi:catechol 2,3-dioxygenase-like lactoylglutathione lyase family enzyme